MPKYNLINPHIEGSFKKTITSKTPVDAAHKTWKNLSEYITGDVPKFAFTLQKEGSNELLHFIVKEQVSNSNVDYTIEKITKKIPKKVTQKFMASLKNHKSQFGGGRRNRDYDEDDEDDEDDIDSENLHIYRRIVNKMNRGNAKPIMYWNYVPWLYELDYVYMPTFIKPLTPYVYIDLAPYTYHTEYFLIPNP